MILIINGPSGSGKTTLGNYFKTFGLTELVSTTTRAPRPGEIEGVSYYFVTPEEFEKIEFVEQSEYSGNKYGITKKEFENKLKSGHSFASLDKNGVKRLKELYPDDVKVIYLLVSKTKLKSRMYFRGDSIPGIMKRMKHYRMTAEDKNFILADYIINNNGNLNKLYINGRRILESEGII